MLSDKDKQEMRQDAFDTKRREEFTNIKQGSERMSTEEFLRFCTALSKANPIKPHKITGNFIL